MHHLPVALLANDLGKHWRLSLGIVRPDHPRRDQGNVGRHRHDGGSADAVGPVTVGHVVYPRAVSELQEATMLWSDQLNCHKCTGMELILGSKVQCVFCFEISTPEGRGGEKGGVQISKQSKYT